MTCFYQLQATNPSSFQIFDLKRKLEKLVCFHNKTPFLILLKSFSRTGNLIPS